jgi:hypothetical protein
MTRNDATVGAYGLFNFGQAPATRRPRTVAAMYGAGETVAPNVSQTIDGEDFTVSVDLTPAADVLLEALAAAMSNNPALLSEWSVLMLNQSDDPARRDLAVRELLQNRQVRRALTVEFTADAAEELSGMLRDAAVEPKRCEGTLYAGTRSQPAEGCQNFALEGEHFCSNHLPADDADTVREYEL